MNRRAAVYGMPFDQIGGGQLHQAILADALTGSYDVDLIHHVPDLTHARLTQDYNVDLRRVNLRYVDPIPAVWPFAAGAKGGHRDAFEVHRELTQTYDLFANVVVNPPIRSFARIGVLVVLFPFVERKDVWPWLEPGTTTPAFKKAIRNAYYARRWRSVFDSYKYWIANSLFTAGWVKTRWGHHAEVIYPPVRANFEDRPKSNTILSVGRFSRKGTQKKQLEMVLAFVRAHDTLLKDWEYLCLGGVADDPDDQCYFQEVCDAARGYPVRLVANPPGSVVKDAYEQAAVFWHAAGFGENELIHPERTEHFGMSTVEAMAAGCVPVVIRKGGQPEIVEQGSSGFLWDTTEELIGYTHQLTSAPHVREAMALAAQNRARIFTDLDRFRTRMLSVIGSNL